MSSITMKNRYVMECMPFTIMSGHRRRVEEGDVKEFYAREGKRI